MLICNVRLESIGFTDLILIIDVRVSYRLVNPFNISAFHQF